MNKYTCPNCHSVELSVFYELNGIPVNSVVLLSTREEALAYPKGNMALGFCENCGFMANTALDPGLHEEPVSSETSQGFSTTFNAFHQNLATRLINQYDLHHKDIIEIGCGQGEFLTLLCELGHNRGIGFDPLYTGERTKSEAHKRITFINDFYSEKYAHYHSDFVCCKMTLEHIPQTADFVSMVRRSIGDRADTIVFFQVPDTVRILRELAFWDIYYEHCSYFSLGSLARLFRQCGFEVIKLAKEYNDQYLMIEARPGKNSHRGLLDQENDLDNLKKDVAYFVKNYPQKIEAWQNTIQEIVQEGQRAVLWGASSKAVGFLTTLNIQAQIEVAVDINPYKHNTYLPGAGQKIVPPEFLQEYKPDVVIVMNPIYCDEIGQKLDKMGIMAKLISV